MMSVAFEYPSNAVESVTQDAFRVFFKGSELVVAGKLRDHSPDVLSAQVRGAAGKCDWPFWRGRAAGTGSQRGWPQTPALPAPAH